ncbi:D-aminoacyl-tRNA deacylase [Haloglomus litoreum]|uniref:D-aminoacyl-tRNA deacylase n=1 Tax=Haloglomus litoreum TaxID=3034026 RepID=UPI0023E8D035|nr:D-aminoacyl-tRNA deacylase [Haloglomus sp. DT116]
MLAIVVSRADSASVHIGEQLRARASWTEHTDGTRTDADGGGTVYRTEGAELREFDDLHLHLDGVASAFGTVDEGPEREAGLLAFASRHAGETGPLLTAHHTGNFGPADHGGADGELAAAAPNATAEALDALTRHAPDGYETGLECTHHGPTDVGCPSLFVEVGSDEPQWDDPDAARAVARTILDLRGVSPDAERSVVCFGGGHYAARPERVVRETDWAVGHIAADWCLDDLGDPDTPTARATLDAAFTESGASHALVEGDHPDLVAVLEDLRHRVVGETYLRETTGVPQATVERAEAELCRVGEGLRFGDRAPGYAGPLTAVELPAGLVTECEGIDRERTREAVDSRTVAVTTTENGTLVDDRALFPATDAEAAAEIRAELVGELVAVLRERYDGVSVHADAVVARRTAFDPEKARTLGVPEGPAFGKLSAGETVEVNGRVIEPGAVRSEEELRFPL